MNSSVAMHEEQFAASFEQERAYVVDRMDDGSAATTAARALTLSGEISTEAMRSALAELTARHEILRTSLRHGDGGLLQVVHPRVEPDLTVEALSSAEADPDSAARELAGAFIERRFELDAAPLWRMLLIRLREDRYVAVLSMHTAVADEATLALVFEEL